MLGPISDQQWGCILELTPKLSPSEAQRFSQLLLFHWVYRSPALLCRIGVRSDSCCPRCNLEDAHILHMFWECSTLGGFWREVLGFIHRVHHLQLPSDPKVCILGILADLDEDSPVFLSISRMLFQARKLIALHWLRPTPPTVREYTDRLNHIIRLEKGVYFKRRAAHRFEAIMGAMVGCPGPSLSGTPKGPHVHDPLIQDVRFALVVSLFFNPRIFLGCCPGGWLEVRGLNDTSLVFICTLALRVWVGGCFGGCFVFLHNLDFLLV